MYIFVYGTLKRGLSNHHYLKNAKYIGEGQLNNYILLDLNLPYPAIYKTDKKHHFVKGEVYEIDETILEKIDYLEGYTNDNSYYYKRTLEIVNCDNKEYLCFVYIWDKKTITNCIRYVNGISEYNEWNG